MNDDSTEQPRVPAPLPPVPTPPDPGQDVGADYTEGGVPTFEHVRDRIEGRFATAVGATELAGDPASIDEEIADRDRAARDRLDQIRRSLHDE